MIQAVTAISTAFFFSLLIHKQNDLMLLQVRELDNRAANDKGSRKIGVKNEIIITKATSRGATAKLANITSITL